MMHTLTKREIKFRYWDSYRKHMIEPSEVFGFDDHMSSYGWAKRIEYYHPDFEEKILTTKNYEMMQYTGIKDKNGKEVFEGDIIQAMTLLNENPFKEGLVNYVTKWSNDYHRWEFISDVADLLVCDPTIDGEVIGNIFEHPEKLASRLLDTP